MGIFIHDFTAIQQLFDSLCHIAGFDVRLCNGFSPIVIIVSCRTNAVHVDGSQFDNRTDRRGEISTAGR